MSDKAKYWIYSFFLTLFCEFLFAGLYWLFFKIPALYDAALRFFGGSGEMVPPREAMMRFAVGIIPYTLFVRVVFPFMEFSESEGKE